jgi:hypothetical protein
MRSHVATGGKNRLRYLWSVGSVLGHLTTGKVGFPMTLSIYFCSQSNPFDSQPNPRKLWYIFLFSVILPDIRRTGASQPYLLASRRTVVCIVTTDLMHQSSNSGRRTFSCLHIGLGPHHASTSLGTKVLSPGVKEPERDTEHSHFHLVQKLKLSRSILLFPSVLLWRGQNSFSLYIRPILFFDFHVTRRQQFVYFNTVSTAVCILVVRVLGGA